MFGRLSGKSNSRDSQDPDFLRAYELGELLGKGAFAHVYRATLKPLEGNQPKDVAVKQIVRGRREYVFNEVRQRKVQGRRSPPHRVVGACTVPLFAASRRLFFVLGWMGGGGREGIFGAVTNVVIFPEPFDESKNKNK